MAQIQRRHPARWQGILGIALSFAENCGAAYRVANERTRTRYNRAVFVTLIVGDGFIATPHYSAPFGVAFSAHEFEQGSLERETGVSRESAKAPGGIAFGYRFAPTA